MKKKSSNKLLLPIAAGVILLAALALLLLPQGKTNAATAGKPLVIPVSEISETASFYPVTVDGTEMEVLAIRTAAGEVRTGMNTCQSCYSSGRGYYVADGTELVCQNCGFRFTAEQVGLEGHGGCNPWPITASQRADTGTEIRIPYETFQAAKTAFANWKG